MVYVRTLCTTMLTRRQLFSVLKRAFADVPVARTDIPLTKGGAAFENDLRATSGLGAGDGLVTHTEKWLEGDEKSPMEYVSEVEPIKVEGLVAISHGHEDAALGCPTEYIDLRGTSYEHPAVCKYTGYRFYSDAWKRGSH